MGLSESGVYRQVAILIGNMIANLPWFTNGKVFVTHLQASPEEALVQFMGWWIWWLSVQESGEIRRQANQIFWQKNFGMPSSRWQIPWFVHVCSVFPLQPRSFDTFWILTKSSASALPADEKTFNKHHCRLQISKGLFPSAWGLRFRKCPSKVGLEPRACLARFSSATSASPYCASGHRAAISAISGCRWDRAVDVRIAQYDPSPNLPWLVNLKVRWLESMILSKDLNIRFPKAPNGVVFLSKPMANATVKKRSETPSTWQGFHRKSLGLCVVLSCPSKKMAKNGRVNPKKLSAFVS